MTNPTKRRLEFTRRTTRSFREQAIAVAWLTAKHGGFENRNVGRHIQRLLAEEGFHVDLSQVTYTMGRLEAMGYAARSIQGGMHRLFVMDPDVVVPEPEFIKAKSLRDAQQQPATNGAAPAPAKRPPVPSRHVDPPWMGELTAVLASWWDENAAEADAWAAEVLTSLGGGK